MPPNNYISCFQNEKKNFISSQMNLYMRVNHQLLGILSCGIIFVISCKAVNSWKNFKSRHKLDKVRDLTWNLSYKFIVIYAYWWGLCFDFTKEKVCPSNKCYFIFLATVFFLSWCYWNVTLHFAPIHHSSYRL